MPGLHERPPPSWARAPRPLLWLAALALALAALLPRAAAACPSCAAAVATRESVIDDDPARWLLIAVAPFAVMFLLAASAYRIGSPARAPRGGAGPRDAQRPRDRTERDRHD